MIGDILLYIAGQRGRKLKNFFIEDSQNDFQIMDFQKSPDLLRRDLQCQILRKAVHTGRNQRKRDTSAAQLLRQQERFAVAGGQNLSFAVCSARPDRADGMNDKIRMQGKSRRHRRFARLDETDSPPCFQQFCRAGRSVNCVIRPAPVFRFGICGIHHRIRSHSRDVIPNNPKRHTFLPPLTALPV